MGVGVRNRATGEKAVTLDPGNDLVPRPNGNVPVRLDDGNLTEWPGGDCVKAPPDYAPAVQYVIVVPRSVSARFRAFAGHGFKYGDGYFIIGNVTLNGAGVMPQGIMDNVVIYDSAIQPTPPLPVDADLADLVVRQLRAQGSIQ